MQIWALWYATSRSLWIQKGKGALAGWAPRRHTSTPPPAPTPLQERAGGTGGKGRRAGKRKWTKATGGRKMEWVWRHCCEMTVGEWWRESFPLHKPQTGSPQVRKEKRGKKRKEKEKPPKNPLFFKKNLIFLPRIKSITGTPKSNKNNWLANHPFWSEILPCFYLTEPYAAHPFGPGSATASYSLHGPGRGCALGFPRSGMQVLTPTLDSTIAPPSPGPPLACTMSLGNGWEPLGFGHPCRKASRHHQEKIIIKKKKYIECLRVRPQCFHIINNLKLPVLFNLFISSIGLTVAE